MPSVSGEFIAFFILAVMAIGGAVFMINFTRVMHMALALVFTFLSIAGIFILLDAEYLAMVQILINVGAVSVLMVFGIMLTRHKQEEKPKARPLHTILSLLGVAALFAVMWRIFYTTPFGGDPADPATVQSLGESIFKQHVIPLELTAVLLLVALVGAIILARREESK